MEKALRAEARTGLLWAAIGLLGAAVWWRNGLYERGAVALVGVAIAVVLACSWRRRDGSADARADCLRLKAIFTGVVGTMTALILRDRPLNDVGGPPGAWIYYLAWGLVGALAAATVWVPARWARAAALGAGVGVLVGGAWAIRSNPVPRVDVYLFQREACAALLRGENPYRLTYANPYSPEDSWVYGEGVVQGDRLMFGYPYLPVTLLGVLPGHAILGDHRYALLGWIVLPGMVLVWRRPTRAACMAVGLMWVFPKLPWVVEWGWSEPVGAGLLVLAAGWRGWEGLFIVGKQYLLPLAPLSWPARPWSLSWAGAALLTVPMILWDVRAFWHSAIALQFRQPFRADSLNVAALAFDLTGGWMMPNAVALGAMVAAVGWLTWRRAGVALGTTVALPLFFFLSKQAFANYWFLVYVSWCMAGLSMTVRRPPYKEATADLIA